MGRGTVGGRASPPTCGYGAPDAIGRSAVTPRDDFIGNEDRPERVSDYSASPRFS